MCRHHSCHSQLGLELVVALGHVSFDSRGLELIACHYVPFKGVAEPNVIRPKRAVHETAGLLHRLTDRYAAGAVADEGVLQHFAIGGAVHGADAHEKTPIATAPATQTSTPIASTTRSKVLSVAIPLPPHDDSNRGE